jgi:hypothetical protein
MSRSEKSGQTCMASSPFRWPSDPGFQCVELPWHLS